MNKKTPLDKKIEELKKEIKKRRKAIQRGYNVKKGSEGIIDEVINKKQAKLSAYEDAQKIFRASIQKLKGEIKFLAKGRYDAVCERINKIFGTLAENHSSQKGVILNRKVSTENNLVVTNRPADKPEGVSKNNSSGDNNYSQDTELKNTFPTPDTNNEKHEGGNGK